MSSEPGPSGYSQPYGYAAPPTVTHADAGPSSQSAQPTSNYPSQPNPGHDHSNWGKPAPPVGGQTARKTVPGSSSGRGRGGARKTNARGGGPSKPTEKRVTRGAARANDPAPQPEATQGPKTLKLKLKDGTMLAMTAAPARKERLANGMLDSPFGHYDRELDSDEDEPLAFEEQFILRVPRSIADGSKKEGIKGLAEMVKMHQAIEGVNIRFKDERRAVFEHGKKKYAAKLVDLPCIIESQKVVEDKRLIKVADISQMLLVEEQIRSAADLSDQPIIDSDFAWLDGIAPPLKNVKNNLWRERKVEYTGEVMDRVADLLAADKDAVSSSWTLHEPEELYAPPKRFDRNTESRSQSIDPSATERAFGQDEDQDMEGGDDDMEDQMSQMGRVQVEEGESMMDDVGSGFGEGDDASPGSDANLDEDDEFGGEEEEEADEAEEEENEELRNLNVRIAEVEGDIAGWEAKIAQQKTNIETTQNAASKKRQAATLQAFQKQYDVKVRERTRLENEVQQLRADAAGPEQDDDEDDEDDLFGEGDDDEPAAVEVAPDEVAENAMEIDVAEPEPPAQTIQQEAQELLSQIDAASLAAPATFVSPPAEAFDYAAANANASASNQMAYAAAPVAPMPAPPAAAPAPAPQAAEKTFDFDYEEDSEGESD